MMHSSASPISRSLVILAVIFLLVGQPAFAYVDPGTGSYLLQMALAGVLGGLYYIKTSWWRVKAWFSSKFTGKKGTPPADEPPK